MAFESSGTLEQDIKDIAIKQMGGEETYRSLDVAGRNKIDSYASDLTGAIKAFLERQEMRITNMEAVGLIRPGSIQVTGGLTTPAAPGAPVSLVNPAINVKPIKLLVQISQTSNKVGLPDVFRNVKKTIVRFLETIF